MVVVQYSSIVKFVTGLCAQKNLEIWATFQIIHTPKFQLLFLIMFLWGGNVHFLSDYTHLLKKSITIYETIPYMYSGMRK